jgi:hypothetical protein
MKSVLLALALIVVVLSVACEPMSPKPEEAAGDIAAMRFVRHSNGLCFGVVRFQTYAGYQGTSITQVSDSACGAIAAK